MGDAGFGQLSYDKGMLVLAATQAENVAWGTLDRSLLTYASINQEPRDKKNPIDLRDWLARTQEQVPELYRKHVLQGARGGQEPVLFDFTRSHGARADN
jgi:hypothetical protein